MNKLISALALLVIVMGCNHPYQYIETRQSYKDPNDTVIEKAVVIKAPNNNLAYEQAYEQWLRSCYAYDGVVEYVAELRGEAPQINKPISFVLLNKKGEDVAKSLDPGTITIIEQKLNERDERLRQEETAKEATRGTSTGTTDYYISKEGYGAITKKALDELVRYLSHNDIQSAQKMLIRGELVPLEVGMGVYMLDYGFAKCKVEISDGPYKGTVVYVITEFVSKR